MATSRTARIHRPTPRNLELLAAALRRGELVAVPTETVYGLAADATNPEACAAIFRAKGRPANDPLIVHVLDLKQAAEVAELNEAARQLAERFWPGPLTLVLPKRSIIPDVATSGGPTVAIRMPAHPLMRRMLRLAKRPLAAPSANPFGYVSPTTARHVSDGLGSQIRFILDGGPCTIGLESTIVDLRDARRPVVLRPGAITAQQISEALGTPVRSRRKVVSTKRAAAAPGMLARHYSPRTPVVLHGRLPDVTPPDEARVHFRRADSDGKANTFHLSEDGSGRSAARRLFGVLRDLDRGRWRRLHIELAPDDDPLAAAINDRLRRAAARD